MDNRITYNPKIFGNTWMKLSGLSKDKMNANKARGMGKSYIIAFIGSLITACILAHFVIYVGATTFFAGMETGFWIWLGFVATTFLGMILWEGKSFKLYALNVGYHLVNLLLMGGIIAVWP